ncbi:ABC transporter permease [Siculibacillus lacustris]|uniref:Autoinducer 2 import system permease protein LsrD n=1 Tax=Siculibacillus lacustris TaxID=1549641 RepID=A0A4Q9VX64_9HYPH|nr:ABC transporter permease [Siculibacillus lacustris]TBW40861.1 ABC transporter permease [Siculibacillus lacustris]
MTARSATLALLAFFVATLAFFWFAAPRFATAGNIENLMSGFSFVAILAIGQAFPILLRGIDLSIGAIVALAGMVAFDLVLILHWPGWLVIPAAILAATLAGALNGVLIVRLRLQPFIATLATLAAYRGLVYSISGRQLVPGLSTTPIRDPWITGLESYLDIAGTLGLSDLITLPWVPLSFFVMLAVLAGFQFMLGSTRFGRDLYTVGGNVEAARLAGIAVGRVTIVAYALSGFCAGVAALLLVARLTTATEALGTGMEMSAIAAAVIGGVSLSGGIGSLYGPVIGAFLLGTILIGLTLLGISQFVQQILTGGILLAAVAYDRVLFLRRQRRLTANLGEEA